MIVIVWSMLIICLLVIIPLLLVCLCTHYVYTHTYTALHWSYTKPSRLLYAAVEHNQSNHLFDGLPQVGVCSGADWASPHGSGPAIHPLLPYDSGRTLVRTQGAGSVHQLCFHRYASIDERCYWKQCNVIASFFIVELLKKWWS